MDCWICGNEAKTGEHLIKASDLRSIFGKVTQQSPLFLSTKNKNNRKIGSIKKSSIIKSKALICAGCNNARTAPFDKAWEQLSKYLRNKSKSAQRSGREIRLDSVFPGNVKNQMLNVHLYFAKLFGCAIVEHKIPIDISGFREAILNQTAHPKLYITFGSSNGLETGNTDVEAANIRGRCAFATWFYVVGSIAANIMYAEPNEKRQGLRRSWHPNTIRKRIKFTKY